MNTASDLLHEVASTSGQMLTDSVPFWEVILGAFLALIALFCVVGVIVVAFRLAFR
jgi:hypothetical protein